ncbi:MAG: Phosphate transport system permease protein PstA [Pelotomaculum sp. PtaB.Bin013]|uniref:Phosphate transport system permease protein PstA n=1 Tax=Pelotomaculum isophthalicicum JI TaxID=947010 RepID=A0A9X4H444_9FIRM|nr:phosphate ABC transporter permease PstA [Pelotomaculum isophthalicicum]MDF9407013.1 phosphate ABC transporter permease PstA [Pelotomaculum isophthalicicum JI]OPX90802.1 MAG: Phosphate transport system permease protein PstA [Pelotomaculum sp. PtaB.Bin013]
MNSRIADRIATLVFWAGALLVIVILGAMIVYILYHGGKYISWDFLIKPPQVVRAGGGIGPQIFNSFYLLFLSMVVTVPVGMLGGIYLAEYARNNKLTEAIRLSIETLNSLPSIVVGLFGLLAFVNMTGWGYSLISGALALTVINLPLMVRITEESIHGVPDSLREASLALGANHWQTICRVVLPSAFPGLVSGAIITSGRVFGEAAALLFTAGMSSPALDFTQWNIFNPASPLNPFRPAETLAVHIWKVNTEGLIPDLRRVADGSAAVLILVVLGFNLAARWLGRKIYRQMTAT